MNTNKAWPLCSRAIAPPAAGNEPVLWPPSCHQPVLMVGIRLTLKVPTHTSSVFFSVRRASSIRLNILLWQDADSYRVGARTNIAVSPPGKTKRELRRTPSSCAEADAMLTHVIT